MSKVDELRKRLTELQHAMQTGVAVGYKARLDRARLSEFG
jgi:hypothetical protein